MNDDPYTDGFNFAIQQIREVFADNLSQISFLVDPGSKDCCGCGDDCRQFHVGYGNYFRLCCASDMVSRGEDTSDKARIEDLEYLRGQREAWLLVKRWGLKT